MIKPQVKVRLLNEVEAVIANLNPDHIEYFYDIYGVYAPNYFFHPKYKLGGWDGKIRYFSKAGKTYVYLLDTIIPKLIKLGYKPILEDLRTSNIAQPDPIDCNYLRDVLHLDTKKPIILEPHQVDAVNSLIEHGNGVVVAGTGSGKTLMCTALCRVYGNHGMKSITIVPDQTLIKQTKREYLNAGLDAGEYSGKEKTPERQHCVSTWQALKNNPSVIQMFQMVIVDECHGLRGNVLTDLLNKHAKHIPSRFGFTGTIPKEEADKLSVHVAVGPVRYEKPAHELIETGFLAKLDIEIVQLEEEMHEEYENYKREAELFSPDGKIVSYDRFKDEYLPDYQSEKQYLINKEPRIEWLAAFIQNKGEQRKGNILCLVNSISFGRKLVKQIPGAIFVNGKDMDNVNERQKVYEMFATNDNLIVVATVHIAGTGLNIRRIFNMMFIDMGKSFIRTIQSIGRGLRKAEDKDSIIVTDICSDLKYGEKHKKERIKYYKEAKYPYKVIVKKYQKGDILVDF